MQGLNSRTALRTRQSGFIRPRAHNSHPSLTDRVLSPVENNQGLSLPPVENGGSIVKEINKLPTPPNEENGYTQLETNINKLTQIVESLSQQILITSDNINVEGSYLIQRNGQLLGRIILSKALDADLHITLNSVIENLDVSPHFVDNDEQFGTVNIQAQENTLIIPHILRDNICYPVTIYFG